MIGFGKKKHKLIFAEYGFTSKKTSYAVGESVTVYYDLIATDTDYSFYVEEDDVDLHRDYDTAHGYVFMFAMPDHDVTIHVSSRNSMLREIPPENRCNT